MQWDSCNRSVYSNPQTAQMTPLYPTVQALEAVSVFNPSPLTTYSVRPKVISLKLSNALFIGQLLEEDNLLHSS